MGFSIIYGVVVIDGSILQYSNECVQILDYLHNYNFFVLTGSSLKLYVIVTHDSALHVEMGSKKNGSFNQCVLAVLRRLLA